MATYASIIFAAMLFFGFTLTFPVLKEIRDEENELLSQRIIAFLKYGKRKWDASKSEISQAFPEEFRKHSNIVWESYQKENLSSDLKSHNLDLINIPDIIRRIRTLQLALWVGVGLYGLLCAYTIIILAVTSRDERIERILLIECACLFTVWFGTLVYGAIRFKILDKLLDRIDLSKGMVKRSNNNTNNSN